MEGYDDRKMTKRVDTRLVIFLLYHFDSLFRTMLWLMGYDRTVI